MVLVTGSSGNVGSAVVGCLRDRHIRFRICARKPDILLPLDDVEVVPFDFLDPSTFHDAVRGCDAVFLLRPPAVSNTSTTLNPFLDVAWAQGVRQVVFLSVAGAANNPLVPHHAVENHLQLDQRDGPFSDQASLLKIWAMPTATTSFTITACSCQPAPAELRLSMSGMSLKLLSMRSSTRLLIKVGRTR